MDPWRAEVDHGMHRVCNNHAETDNELYTTIASQKHTAVQSERRRR